MFDPLMNVTSQYKGRRTYSPSQSQTLAQKVHLTFRIYTFSEISEEKSDYFLLKGEFLCACHALPMVTLYIDTKENHQIHIFKQNYIK